MRIALCWVAFATALSGSLPAAHADVWDVGNDNDNTSNSDNELVNGLDQVHDMAAQMGGAVEDVDWYPFRYACNSSHEILLDGLTGAVGNATNGKPALDLLSTDATTILASAQVVTSLGIARRITRFCFGTDSESINYVRVSQPDCGVNCVGTDQYHIHYRDTTALVPRFNNSATQVSNLVLQNASSKIVSGVVLPYDATGAVIDYTIFFALIPNQVTVINLSTVSGGVLAGKSGGLKIVSDAPYGTLAGKVVALEVASGFTFDTPLVYKPPEE
jgi:hypothetical protein